MKLIIATTAAAILMSGVLQAEYKKYGVMTLKGKGISVGNPVVCNVNGSDGFLTIRSCPSTKCKSVRKLNRLAFIDVDASQQKGKWVRVVGANRTHSSSGKALPASKWKTWNIKGWAHKGYLCNWTF